jgi:hypothetical protein
MFSSIDEWFDVVAKMPSDFNEHMPTLRALAAKCDMCVELSHWLKPALLSMAAGKPKRLMSFCPGVKPEWAQMKQLFGDGFESRQMDSIEVPDGKGEIDLLFIDTKHQASRLDRELEYWGPHCRHYIVVHCTMTYGERGDDGGPGVLVALRKWVRAHSQWTAVDHYTNNHGLTVLSCKPEDKEKSPSLVKQAWNFSKAMTKFAASGLPVLNNDRVEARLNVCDLCKHRTDDRCSVCGCPLTEGVAGVPGKAFIPSEVCPLGYWPE